MEPMPLMHLIGLLSLPVVAIWPATATIIHLHRFAKSRFSPQKGCLQAGVLVSLASLVLWLSLSLSRQSPDLAETLSGIAYLAIYCFCCSFLNWFIFTVTETSMHTHLLVEIGRDDGIALSELQRRYNKSTIIAARIDRLLEIGQLRLRNGHLILGGSWVLAGAEGARLLRVLLSIPPQPVQEDDPNGN